MNTAIRKLMARTNLVVGGMITLIIIIVAVLTNLTAFHRIIWVHGHGSGIPLNRGESEQPSDEPSSRSTE